MGTCGHALRKLQWNSLVIESVHEFKYRQIVFHTWVSINFYTKPTEDHLVITNGEEPMAIAGVMGGEKSEVQEDTKNILLEAAYFEKSYKQRKVANKQDYLL